MMKIKSKSKTSKKIILLILSALVLLLAGLGTYLYAFKGTLFGWSPLPKVVNSIDYNKPTKEQTKAGTDTKENSVNPVDSETKPNSGSDQPPAPSPQPSGKSKVEITISAPPVGSTVNTNFQVRSLLATVTNSGTCTLTFTKTDSATVTKTAGVQPLASTSTCQGFDVTLSPGIWQMTLNFENENLIGSVSQAITVQ